MRSFLLSLVLPLLLVAAPAQARQNTDVSGGPFEAVGAALVKSWDCKETLLDARGRNDLGFAACLRGLAMDTVSGRSTVVLEFVLDSKDPLGDLSELMLKLRLDSGRTERTLEAFTVAATHLGDAPSSPPELFLPAWLEPTAALVASEPEDERQHVTIAWNFQTWDPSIDLQFFQLKVVGGGIGGKARWAIPDGLGHDGGWDARAEFVWDDDWADVACDVWRVRKSDAGKASDALTDGAHDLPLQMRFDVFSDDEDGEFEVHFPDHKFTVTIAGGKLKVRGLEDFTHPLGDQWRTGDVPNLVELVYDGTFVTVRINDDTFGPMAGKQREGKRFRWELGFEDGKNEIRNLQVAPCTLEAPEDWVAPEPKKKEERSAVAAAPSGSVPTGGGARTPRGKQGKVVWAVLTRNDVPVNDVRKKRKKSALEVMTTAASIGQGLMATGQGLSQFGQDVDTNLKAAKSGDYESMKSSDTRVDVGPCGSSVTRSEASVSNLESGSPTVNMQGERTNYSNPGCANGVPLANSLPAQPMSSAKVCTLTVLAEDSGTVAIGGEVLGTMAAGDRWVAQIAPGTHAVEVDGRGVGMLTADKGAAVTLSLGDGASADPAGALQQR